MVAGQTILGLNSRAFEFSVRNSDIYTGVGGYARTQADLVMFQQFIGRDRYIAYVPYGPEIEPSEENQGRFLEELSEYLRSYLDPGCVAIRYDLNWMSRWCKAEDFVESGRWRGLPKKEFQEINLNFGTAEHNLRKSNMNVLPADTSVLDLTRSEERILASMKPETRYNIRLSQKKAIEVRAGLAHSTSGTRPTSKRLAATGCTSTTSGTSARFFPRSSQTK